MWFRLYLECSSLKFSKREDIYQDFHELSQ